MRGRDSEEKSRLKEKKKEKKKGQGDNIGTEKKKRWITKRRRKIEELRV